MALADRDWGGGKEKIISSRTQIIYVNYNIKNTESRVQENKLLSDCFVDTTQTCTLSVKTITMAKKKTKTG